MSPHRFTKEELEATLTKYPKLTQQSDGVLVGEIDINHQFGDVHIVDSFQISIGVDDNYPESFPRLTEIGGSTESIAERYGITDYRDLHCYAIREPGAACVCASQERRRKFAKGNDLVVYVDDLAIPYLYGLSYYEQYQKWPWGERSHGALGSLEAYAEIDKPSQADITDTLITIRVESEWITYHKQIKKVSPNKGCPCKSGKPFGRCHKDALVGLEKLAKDSKKFGLNIKGLLDVIANRLKNSKH